MGNIGTTELIILLVLILIFIVIPIIMLVFLIKFRTENKYLKMENARLQSALMEKK